MALFTWFVLTGCTTCMILSLFYTALLIHILNGNKNKWLTFVVSMLLISNIAFFMICYLDNQIFTLDEPNQARVIAQGIGWGVSDSTFSVSHFLLAVKYGMIAKDVPKILDKEEVTRDPRKEAIFFWVVLAGNILFPIVEAFSIISFNTAVLIQKEPYGPIGLTVAIDISSDGVGMMQIISGVMLVRSVQTIRTYFKERNDEDYINTSMLMRHAFAFGLFLIGTILKYAAFTVYSIYPNSGFAWNAYSVALIFCQLTSFVSQYLLCVIFWGLGEKNEDDLTDDDSHTVSLEVEDFDEDAEL